MWPGGGKARCWGGGALPGQEPVSEDFHQEHNSGSLVKCSLEVSGRSHRRAKRLTMDRGAVQTAPVGPGLHPRGAAAPEAGLSSS